MPAVTSSSTLGEERTLAMDLRAGDGDALRRFQEHLGPALHHYLASRFGGFGIEADDLYQETLIKIWRSAESFDAAQGSLRAWAFAIARNAGIDRLRSDPRARRRLEERFRDFARRDPRFENHRRELEAAIEQQALPPLGRHIVAADLAGFPSSDDAALSEALNTSSGSIQAQRSKAYKRLGIRALRRRDALEWFAESGRGGQARLLGLRIKKKEPQ